jgi:transcriptional regulator with XRE-family HTH domain
MTTCIETPPIDEATKRKRWDKAVSRAIGEELRRVREANGWTRGHFVTRLPSGIGARTLLSYEHGTRHLTVLRFIEVCRALGVATPTVLHHALQRARLYLDTLPLRVDLYAIALDESGDYPFLIQWAHNTLEEMPEGVMDVEPAVVRNLARCFGCDYQQLTRYMAGFLAEEVRARQKREILPSL